MSIKACPRCGSKDLRMPGFADGIVPETDNLNEYVCGKCDLRANPIVFDAKADYEAFLEGLA